jgi:hypothetical protein
MKWDEEHLPAIVFLLTLLALMSGCFSKGYTSGLVEPDLRGATAKDSAYVSARAIYVGMPVRFATEVLGPPDRVIQANRDGEIWRYNFTGRCLYTQRCRERHYRSTIVVRGGQIEEINDFPGHYLTP